MIICLILFSSSPSSAFLHFYCCYCCCCCCYCCCWSMWIGVIFLLLLLLESEEKSIEWMRLFSFLLFLVLFYVLLFLLFDLIQNGNKIKYFSLAYILFIVECLSFHYSLTRTKISIYFPYQPTWLYDLLLFIQNKAISVAHYLTALPNFPTIYIHIQVQITWATCNVI